MFRTKILLTAALVTAGIVGGVLFSWSLVSDPEVRESPQETEEHNNRLQRDKGQPLSSVESPLTDKWETLLEEKPVVVDLEVNHVEQGDRYLRVGNIHKAYQQYLKATNDYLSELPPSLLMRLAIATEKMGDGANSNRHYQNAVRLSPDKSLIRLLGLAGVARTWQNEGMFSEAHELLGELFLVYISNDQVHPEVRFQIAGQLGNLAQVKCLATMPEPRSMDRLEFDWSEPNVDFMLEILQDLADVRVESRFEGTESIAVRTLQRPSSDINLIAVEVMASLTPIEQILEAVSENADIEIDLSDLASSRIRRRSWRLDVDGLSVAVLLDQLFHPLGLVWQQQGDTIHVYGESEAEADRQAYLFEYADRILANIELLLPADARRNTTLLHRGNLRLLIADQERAVAYYDKLSKMTPGNELAAKLGYNLALVDESNGNFENAVQRFFYTGDQSLDQRLQSRSYAWIGRLELHLGRSDSAVYALSRSLAMSDDPQVRQEVAINLAKAHLLESDPFSANLVLLKSVVDIVDALEKKKAAVFAAYARFLGTVASEGLRNEGERLIIALSVMKTEEIDDFVDQLVIGRAFSEVGFKNRSADFLDLALKSAPHDLWRRRIAFELATNHFRAGELPEARKHYQSLIVEPGDRTSLLAQIKLAEIALTEKKLEDCIALCRQIWKQKISDEQKAETLSVLGRAFQQQGRYQIAAACFSGVFPAETDSFESESRPVTAVN